MKFLKKLAFIFITTAMAVGTTLEDPNEDKWYNLDTFDVGQWYSSPAKATDPMTGMDLKDILKRKMSAAYADFLDENGNITPAIAEKLNAKILLFIEIDKLEAPVFHAVVRAYAKNDVIRILIGDLYGPIKKPEEFTAWLTE